ncbi:hypothetical protein CH063_15373 [Colletotrichum higginsianum]|uniref:Uncharacterized protein n=1 Tax=Colletotrichum higginsianum (strain IMI 349063) TaxID=759273 RepID=H1W2I6_COLHI|nr:hypothetical protein CH063_15373 [Colletotrichum higginsianum]
MKMIQTENLGVLGFYPLTSLHRSPRSDADTVVTGPSSEFPYPAMSPPKPTFEFGFRVAVRLAPDVAETVVEGGKTVELARVVCGSWSGPLGSGVVLSAGHDLDKTRLKTRPIHQINTAFKLQTGDEEPAMLEMGTRGFLSGTTDVLRQTACRTEDEARVDPRRYCYRMAISLTTTDMRYVKKVGGALWVGTGMWDLNELVIDAYRVV